MTATVPFAGVRQHRSIRTGLAAPRHAPLPLASQLPDLPMPEPTTPRLELQTDDGATRVRLLGHWTAARFAERGLFGSLQQRLAGLQREAAWDLRSADQLDHVGAQLLWDTWG